MVIITNTEKCFNVKSYDMLHFGHILPFKRANELGDKLIVAF